MWRQWKKVRSDAENLQPGSMCNSEAFYRDNFELRCTSIRVKFSHNRSASAKSIKSARVRMEGARASNSKAR